MNLPVKSSHTSTLLPAAVLLAVCPLLIAPSQARASAVWTRTFAGNDRSEAAENEAHAAVADDQGDVYVTGSSSTTSHGNGMSTIKYDPSGKELWVHSEDVSGDTYFYYASIALDASGNVTALGEGASESGATVVTYSPSGARLKLTQITFPVQDVKLSDNDNGLQLYSNGDFSVEGYVDSYNSGYDAEDDFWFVARYSSAGKLLWYDDYTGYPASEAEGGVSNYADGAAVNKSGDLVVGGSETDSNDTLGMFLRAYSPTGQILYSTEVTDPSLAYTSAGAFTVDAKGHFYIAGNDRPSDSSDNYVAMAKFAQDGTLLWLRDYTAPGGSSLNEYGAAVTVDKDENAILGGVELGNDFNADLFVKWDSKGDRLWAHTADKFPANALTAPSIFAIAGTNKFYAVTNVVTGSKTTPNGQSQVIVTNKIGSDGIVESTQTYTGDPSYGDGAQTYGSTYDPLSDSLYVVGRQYEPPYGSNSSLYPQTYWVTLKYQLGD